MTKQELAFILHEYNIDCKIKTKSKEVCPNCYRLIGHLMIALGNEMTREGVKRLKDVYGNTTSS